LKKKEKKKNFEIPQKGRVEGHNVEMYLYYHHYYQQASVYLNAISYSTFMYSTTPRCYTPQKRKATFLILFSIPEAFNFRISPSVESRKIRGATAHTRTCYSSFFTGTRQKLHGVLCYVLKGREKMASKDGGGKRPDKRKRLVLHGKKKK
jgi:hypothetical protein